MAIVFAPFEERSYGLNLELEVVARVPEADVLDQRREQRRSLGSRPRSTSSAIMLQSRRRKYSWRENDRKLRESVSMPTNRDSRPRLERASICLRMPSSWSRNHQALPSCIFPGVVPSLKLPMTVAKASLSAGFRL